MSSIESFISARASVRLEPEARPIRRDVPGAREAVLLLHGFTGIPRELAAVAEGLAASGYSCLAPRYPGHGTGRADFVRTGAEDWLGRAMDSYLELASEYERVHVVGHSMGGVIGGLVAAAFDVPRLVLLAPAFLISDPGLRLSPLAAPFTKVIRRGRPVPDAEEDPVRRRLHTEYWSDDLVGGAAQLRRLVVAGRRVLPRLRSKVLVLLGERDEVVPASVMPYLRVRLSAAVSFEGAFIPGSDHLFPFKGGSEEAAARVVDWMRRP